LFDFRLYLPRSWCEDESRPERTHVPADVEFAAKTGAGARFGWAAAGDVDGRSSKRRAAREQASKGYVLAVPCDFKVALHPRRGRVRADAAARRVPAAGWGTRSCGTGARATATTSGRGWRPPCPGSTGCSAAASPTRPSWRTSTATPAGRPASLAMLISAAGRRWPVEECHQQAKGQADPGHHQVRLWQSFHRHTVLSMCALALLAIAAARLAAAPLAPGAAYSGTVPDAAAAQPADWAGTGILPASADEAPPEDPGLVGVSVPEACRLLRLATTPMTAAARQAGHA
jgi:hypothetical protein